MAQLRARYLHADVARGYTEQKSMAAFDEPEAIPVADQEQMSKAAREHWDAEQADKIAQRESASWLRRLVASELTALEYGFDISRYHARIRREVALLEAEVDARKRKADARRRIPSADTR